jgi:predicted AlkP superfamily pyrophosphatase or phosphodiesterase
MAPIITADPAHPAATTPALLSPSNHDVYDDADARSIRSAQDSDADTDTDDDDDVVRARTSAEIREHDRELLDEEEERDRMLNEARSGGGGGTRIALPRAFRNVFGRRYEGVAGGAGSDGAGAAAVEGAGKRAEKRGARRARRRARKEGLVADAVHGEDRELMYEMEEGGVKDGSETGESSDPETPFVGHGEKAHWPETAPRSRKHLVKKVGIYALIAALFAVLAIGAWRLSIARKPKVPVQKMFSNGTALFAPTTILISLDGFRADFLKRGVTPRLNAFIEEGVSPPYMLPSFPSVTFPNHYTLVTGLYPESHGVVGNTFWDPALQKDFFYTDPSKSMQDEWWGGEPLWVTAEKQGIRSAIHMWPGSEAHIRHLEPSFLDTYNGREKLPNKAARILELLDKPGLEDPSALTADMRPQLILAYVPDIDSYGHKYGPNSTEIVAKTKEVDDMLETMFRGLEERNLTSVVNVVVVSDHGMATTSTDRLIQLDDIIDMSLIHRMDGWPLYGLRPKDPSPSQLRSLYETLLEESKQNPNFDVYLRDETMPERYHFSNNERIAPLWIVPKTGWAIVTREHFDVKEAKEKGLVYHPRGLHGYDHEHPLMRSIFVARGPAFPHRGNSRLEVFRMSFLFLPFSSSFFCHLISYLPLKPLLLARFPLFFCLPFSSSVADGRWETGELMHDA